MSMSSWRAAQEPGFFGYPDDDEACIPHGNRKDDCPECLADFKRDEAAYLAWRNAGGALGRQPRRSAVPTMNDTPTTTTDLRCALARIAGLADDAATLSHGAALAILADIHETAEAALSEQG